jgi:very-short-patch-repair endonuclease
MNNVLKITVESNVLKHLSYLAKLSQFNTYMHLLLEMDAYKIKSPIEQLFYATFSCQKIIGSDLRIIPQKKIGEYIVDFLIKAYNPQNSETFPKVFKEVIVELDGHEFHEMTEKERRYEKARDRFLQKQGYKVFHFTGKEVTDNPFTSVNEVMKYLCEGNHVFGHFTDHEEMFNLWNNCLKDRHKEEEA